MINSTCLFGEIGTDKDVQVNLINFENPKANTLRVTTEATFHIGREHRRYDLVLWVNGFPLVVGEMKTPKDKNISWRDFETGVKLGKLKREEKTSLVLYEADSEVTVDAFMPHMHPGGEAYLVLEGEVWDEEGTYPTGSIVWMNRETTHTPKTRGKTLILVLWPEGVKSA